jgi:hypothetical protein
VALAAAEALKRLGGSATLADILQLTTRKSLRCAERRGEVHRLSRGVYALEDTLPEQKAAAAAHGVISHQSAAAYWLMDSIFPPSSIHVTVTRNARPVSRKGVTLHYANLDQEEVTSPLQTVLDCAAVLPFREALAIADSACRRELITGDQLLAAAQRLRGPGSQRAQRVGSHVDARAENPFESAMRAVAIDSGISGFQPQLVIPGGHGSGRSGGAEKRVDLGDPERMIVFEADSFAFHGSREALDRDCLRYNELVSQGWLVLRFTYDHVILEPARTGQLMLETCALRSARAIRARRSHP